MEFLVSWDIVLSTTAGMYIRVSPTGYSDTSRRSAAPVITKVCALGVLPNLRPLGRQ